MIRGSGLLPAIVLIVCVAPAALAPFDVAQDRQRTDWTAVQAEAVRLLQEYVRIDTSNPPGVTRAAADFLTRVLERDGISVTRYESQPGKAIVLARLKAARPTGAKAILLLHGTDSNSFRPRGVKSYGIAPVAVSADVVASMHGDAEHVPIADLAKGARILFEALREAAR